MTDDRPSYAQRERADSFGRVAADYHQYRPRYPQAFIEEVVGAGFRSALDIGCGTGILTRQLVEAGIDTVGVEPDPQMAAVAREQGLSVVAGTAETFAAPAEPVDLITFGQAWHWVNPEIALPRLRRMLRPGGALVLIWNRVEALEPTEDQVADVLRSVNPDYPVAKSTVEVSNAQRVGFDELTAAGFALRRLDYQATESIPAQLYVDRLFTYSVNLLLPAEQAALGRERLTRLIGGRDVHIKAGAVGVWATVQ